MNHLRTAPSSPTMSHAKSRSPLQERATKPTPPPCVRPPQAAHTWSAIHQTQGNFNVKLPSQRRRKPLDLGLSAWGPRHFHCLTPLPRTQISEAANRATPPPNRCQRNHRTMRTASRPSAPSCQHELRTSLAAVCKQHWPTTTTARPRRVSICGASKEGTTPGAVVPRP
jgi:hypothetical protein